MPQPSGQLLVDDLNPLAGLFFYAQDTSGLWDANNGALLTKTGTAGMAVEAGANVVLGNASTHYSLAAAQTLTAPFTLRSRSRKAVGTTTNSMTCGDMASTNHFVWLDSGTGRLRLRCKYSGAASYAEVNSTNPVDTTSLSIISITVEANGAWAMYQDDALIASGSMSGTGTPQFILSAICGGYSGGSFRLNGSLEFFHAIPDHAATAGEIAALNADPYGVLAAGGPPTLTIINSSHSNTADNPSLDALGSLAIFDAIHSHATDSITLTATSNGTLTIPAIRDWGTKALKAGETGVTVDIYSKTTRGLVVSLTGQTTHATTAVCVVSDPAIVAGTTYRVVTEFADGSFGVWDYTAS